MSAVNPTTGANGSTTLSTSGTSATGSNTDLGEGDFLTLMMDQLKDQDPLNPTDSTQYMSELAQFSSLEAETSTASNTSQAASSQNSAAALQLLGHTVTYTNADGTTATGTVQKVDFTSSGPSLTIGGVSGVSLGSITEAS